MKLFQKYYSESQCILYVSSWNNKEYWKPLNTANWWRRRWAISVNSLYFLLPSMQLAILFWVSPALQLTLRKYNKWVIWKSGQELFPHFIKWECPRSKNIFIWTIFWISNVLLERSRKKENRWLDCYWFPTNLKKLSRIRPD